MPTAAQVQLVLAHEWLHAFEEDSGPEDVYRPVTTVIAPTRRPRERVRLSADGSATVAVGGADDRFEHHQGTWSVDGEHIVVRATGAPAVRTTYRIVAVATDRLLMRVS